MDPIQPRVAAAAAIDVEEIAPAVTRVAIANPPLNVLTQAVRRELGIFLAGAQERRDLRCVIFGSGERAFSAGADLREFPLRFDAKVARTHGENAHRMMRALVELDIPVIASIRGFCMGGGLELALGCTFRLAARNALFALPEIDRGVWPGTGGIALLTRLIGPVAAKKMLYGGQRIDAEQALALGIVDEIVDNDVLDQRALELASLYASKPGQSVRTITSLADHEFRSAFRRHLEVELEAFVLAYQSRDAAEGNQAFFEKRAPLWRHR
jgi:enoyl-CoA hydratase